MSRPENVVILCGGKGTRLGDKTEKIPKPLLPIGSKPILWHIMKIYSFFGFSNFILCVGYKGDSIKSYFEDTHNEEWNVNCVDTGIDTGTAGRIKKIEHLVSEDFFVTYGDGLSDLSIDKLLDFHKNHGKKSTVTAVRPLIRFGMLDIVGEKVISFDKYSAPQQGWIDGGFFVFKKSIFDYFGSVKDSDMLEGPILEKLARDGQLMANKYEGYWRCIDTSRDLASAEKDFFDSKNNWVLWNE